MATLGINLDEVSHFIEQMEKLKKQPIEKLEELVSREVNKSFIDNFILFLQYKDSIKPENFTCYRVRKIDNNLPYTKIKDLLYPPKEHIKEGRMNDRSNIVLYTSLNEYTAIAESEITELNTYFQLTRFQILKEIYFFEIGRFSQIFFNMPRDSKIIQEYIKNYNGNISDSLLQGLAALECAIIDILYSSDDHKYLLTSFIANSIYKNMPQINAIKYPSTKNKFGTNFAIKQDFVDSSLKPVYSGLNCIKEIYPNGFFKYNTEKECTNFSNESNLEFTKIDNQYSNNQIR